MAHTLACKARIELAVAQDDDPKCNAATDRIAHRLEDSVAPAATAPPPLPPPEAAPATPVLTEKTLFDTIFEEEKPGPSVE